MKIFIANPIYDSVFKFLMEDERIAKTILSALLKKKIKRLQARPHEYTNRTRETISMFRIDFSAVIEEENNKESLILIELQKTWLETETLRFRQYLGAQYSDKRNIRKDSRKGYALPMVTIYILGHRLGDIDVPVLYVNHKAYDYEGNEVTKGIPDQFIESMVHNCIIVQIPLLHGQVNNDLEKVLTVFDQTKADKENNHFLAYDTEEYSNDKNLEYVVQKLTAAAASPDVRQDMNVEDEYFAAIEERDTLLMNRDKRISEQDKTISEQNTKISEQNTKISEQNTKISEQNSKISEQNSKISEQNSKISEQNSQLCSLVRLLYKQGMMAEQIAAATGVSIEQINMFLGETDN